MTGNFELPPKIDLGLILDSSVDMGLENMHKSGLLVRQLLDRLSISPGTTRVAFYSVSNTSKEHFQFKTHVNRKCLLSAVQNGKINFGDKNFNFVSLLSETFNTMHAKSKNTDEQKRIYLFITNTIDEYNNLQDKLNFKLKTDDFLGLVLFDYDQDTIKNKNKLKILTFNKKEDIFQILKHLKIPNHSYTKCKVEGKKIKDECNRECTCNHGKLSNCYRIRHEFTTMTKEERQRYLKAYTKLTTVSPYKEVYERFIFMHYKYFCWGIHTERLVN